MAFTFGAFWEGCAGFGTPVVVAATMLVGLGFSAFSASAICLLANTAPVAFGAIEIPVITLAGTTGLPLGKLSRTVALLCSPAAFIIPVYLIVATDGFGAMTGIWNPTLAAGAVFAVVQLLVSDFIGPQLSAILSSIASMIVIIVLLRFRGDKGNGTDTAAKIEFAGVSKAGSEVRRATGSWNPSTMEVTEPLPEHTPRQILYAWVPYALLVVCVFLWGLAPIIGY